MFLCIAIFRFAYMLIVFFFRGGRWIGGGLIENKCQFDAYNWLQISCVSTLLLINSSLLLLFLFVTSYNLQTLNVLCSFIISVCMFAFLVFHVCKFNIIMITKKVLQYWKIVLYILYIFILTSVLVVLNLWFRILTFCDQYYY